MDNKLLTFSLFLLACSVLFSGLYIGWAIKELSVDKQQAKEQTLTVESALLTQEQAAAYLNLDTAAFQQILTKQSGARAKMERDGISSYAIYTFIPYIQIKGKKYFSKTEINKWIEYNMLNTGGHAEEILR